jgi:hypothetical protein
MMRTIALIGAIFAALGNYASAVTLQVSPGETWNVDLGQEHLIVSVYVFNGEEPGSIFVEAFNGAGAAYGSGPCFGICEFYGDLGNQTEGIRRLTLSAILAPWAVSIYALMPIEPKIENIATTPLPTSLPLFAAGLVLIGLLGWLSGRSPTSVS